MTPPPGVVGPVVADTEHVTDQFTTTDETVTSGWGPERPERSRTDGLVPFVFGVTGAEQLPGLALVRLLGDLGVGVSAARGQLARMRRNGQLAICRRGREVDYSLTGPFAEQFRRLRDGSGPPPPWKGHFHALLYQLPEAQRAYRDRLRRGARLAGYGLMQPGVLISVADLADDLAAVLAEAPPGCHLHQVTLGATTDEAAEIAARAWDLDTLAATLRGHITTLRAALNTDYNPPPTATTVRRLAELRNAPLVDLIDDPNLPPELLPASWPVPELAYLMSQARDRYQPPAARYAHTFTVKRPDQQPGRSAHQ